MKRRMTPKEHLLMVSGLVAFSIMVLSLSTAFAQEKQIDTSTTLEQRMAELEEPEAPAYVIHSCSASHMPKGCSHIKELEAKPQPE